MPKIFPSIELRHLRYFLAAAEQRSFRKAGIVLGVQESTVSRAVRDMEDRLGASLFQRFNSGVRLTIAGEQFQSRAELVVRQISDGGVDVSAIGCGARGRLRIGIVASIAKGFAADLLCEFSRTHEAVYIELVDSEQAEHAAALQRFDLDIAFLMGDHKWCGCEVATLWSERLHIVMPEGHPLSEHRMLSWTDVARETFIVAGTALGMELRSLLTMRLAELGHSPSLQPQGAGYGNLFPLVAPGRGLMLGIEETIAPGILSRPISGEFIPFGAVWSPRNDNPALRRFLSMIRRRSVPQLNCELR